LCITVKTEPRCRRLGQARSSDQRVYVVAGVRDRRVYVVAGVRDRRVYVVAGVRDRRVKAWMPYEPSTLLWPPE